MKRWIIGIGLVALLIGGLVYYVNSGALKLSFGQLEGEIKKAERKRLSIPIRASGLIEPASPPIEIKSKASGEVAEILVKSGDMVRKGQLLLRLDPKDEDRNLARAKAQMDHQKALLEKARVALRQMEEDYPTGIAIAKATQAKAEALLKQIEWEQKRLAEAKARGATTGTELFNNEQMVAQMQADVELAKAQVEKAVNVKLQIEAAKQDVAVLEADHESAVKTYEEAVQRRKETERGAPIDGMITKVNVRVGEMIQSGTTSLTGGTMLMTIADIRDLYVTAQVDEADISTVLDLAPADARPGKQRMAAMAQSGSASAARTDTVQTDAVAAAASQVASLAEGKAVKITVEAFREESFEGRIEHISPEPLKQQSVVTYDVRIKLTGENRSKLLLGMQADAEFTLESVDAVVIPVDAVKILDGEAEKGDKGERGVYVPVRKAGRPVPDKEWRKCRFGLDDGSSIEVIEGLKEGDEVFTKVPYVIEREKK